MLYRRTKRKNYFIILVMILLGLGIGYALISTDLTINGVGKFNNNTWDIHFEDLTFNPGNVTLSTGDVEATINQTTHTDISFTVTLQEPGDFYEFEVAAVNSGTMDAMIGLVTNNLNNNPISSTNPVPTYARYTATYSDGVAIEPNHLLEAGYSENYKVRVEYRTDINPSDLPDTVQALTFNFGVQYVQADSNAVSVNHPVPFDAQLGDYFTMVPDASTYIITSGTTGYSSDQTITPNELTLWRVININQDGTIEAVSEYVSSTEVYFQGTTGYANFVGGLQTIAAQYAKTGYTVNTRMMGYDGQTLTISDTSAFDGTTSTAPSTTSTPSPYTGTGEEYSGGVLGDTLYLKDIQLVGDVYKTDKSTYGTYGLYAYKVNATTTNGNYWLASRRFLYSNAYDRDFHGRGVFSSSLTNLILRRWFNGWSDNSNSNSLRPIITLKSGITTNGGSGTKVDPYTLA